MSLALERQHRVDDVLEHARAGERPLLRHVPDQHDGHAALLGDVDQLLGASAHLDDRSGWRPERRVVDGLDRVDHDDVGLGVGHRGEDVRERGLRKQPEIGSNGVEALGSQAHLLRALLGCHVQRRPAEGGHQLEQQGALADPGLAAEQGDRAGDEPAAEHPVELADRGGSGLAGERIDVADPSRRPGRRDGRHIGDGDLLDEGVPLTARRALPGPLRVGRTAVGADVFDPALGHARHHDVGVSHRSGTPHRPLPGVRISAESGLVVGGGRCRRFPRVWPRRDCAQLRGKRVGGRLGSVAALSADLGTVGRCVQ